MGNTCSCEDQNDDRKAELEIEDVEDIKQLGRILRAQTHKKSDFTKSELEFLKNNKANIQKV